VTPLGIIGESLSQFFAGTMRHVPGFMWPIIICVIIVLFIVGSLVYLRYEIHLPFMMGSIRPSASASITTAQTRLIELSNNSSNLSPEHVARLESQILHLQQQSDNT
jgi:hypothetical protein